MEGTVLVVEDDTDTRELLVGALRKRGFTASGARSGDLALAALQDLDVRRRHHRPAARAA